MDERMLLSGPAECLFLAINFSLRIALLSVTKKGLFVCLFVCLRAQL